MKEDDLMEVWPFPIWVCPSSVVGVHTSKSQAAQLKLEDRGPHIVDEN